MDLEDKSKNIGIQIVTGMASDIQSWKIMDLNVLAVRLDAKNSGS